MSASAQGGPCEPFFLPATPGERFCIFYPPAKPCHGGIVYVHPFAEEMNKSRRMAALQSRLFAARGIAVLQMDLLGCGDSSGDFGDASWDRWGQDVALGVQWIRQRVDGPITLWGLRLGALLALDSARFCDPAPSGFLLWQPVISGEIFLTQFLRLRTASGMFSNGAQTSTQELRDELNAGSVIEISGYDLAPALGLAIDRLKLSELAPSQGPLYWFEVVPEAGRQVSPASQRVAEEWMARGLAVHVCASVGEPFWNTVEIVECPALLADTTHALAEAWG